MFKIKNISLFFIAISYFFICTDILSRHEERIKEIQELGVRVIFIRHGYSCANIVKDSGYIREIFTSYPDPELSQIGLNLSKENGKKLKNEIGKRGIEVDFIASSSLIRAIETAYYIFGREQPIYTLPYVAEKGKTVDNMALDLNQQRKIISEKNALSCLSDADCPIKFMFSDKSAGRSESNYKEFINWFSNNLDTILAQSQKWEPTNGALFTIAIITHSNFLGRELGLSHPANNAAFENMLKFKRQGNNGWKFVEAEKTKFMPINYDLTPAPDRENLKKALENLGEDRCRIDVTKGSPK